MRLLPVLVIAFFTSPAFADDCLKMVFNDYCLGGDLKAIIDRNPPDDVSRDGDATYIIYKESADETVSINAIEGKVAVVGKFMQPGSWLNYRSWKARLEEIYGAGDDRSYFPDYANSDSSKATAISLGKGRALHVWDQGEWMIALAWRDREFGINLGYMHKALMDVMKNRQDAGL